jgi:hypothetical protein
MTGPASKSEEATRSVPKARVAPGTVLGAVCALVVGVYAWSAKSGEAGLGGLKGEHTYYGRLVQGFRSGQLNLKREPSGLAQLLAAGDQVSSSPVWLMDNELLDLS